jgi:hypothetical protein
MTLQKGHKINIGRKFSEIRPYGGEKNPFFGKTHTKKVKEMLSVVHSGKHHSVKTEFKKGDNLNEKHPNWRGDEACYDSKHSWIRRKLGQPDTCSKCKRSKLYGRKIHWANISKEYKRDFSDWVRLCASCHKLFDLGKIEI